jgi:hypothetical protein
VTLQFFLKYKKHDFVVDVSLDSFAILTFSFGENRKKDTSVIDIPDSCFHNLVLAGIMSVSVQFHHSTRAKSLLALTPIFFTISTFTKLYSN